MQEKLICVIDGMNKKEILNPTISPVTDWPNSTQKTSLIGDDCPHIYVVLLHHQFLMWD
jgi:hypothetical protein